MQFTPATAVSFDELPHPRQKGADAAQKTNLSLFTETTETTTTFSEQDEIDEPRAHYFGTFLGEQFDEDEHDSLSMNSVRTSLDDLDTNLPAGMPGEILVIDEDNMTNEQSQDIQHRLMIAESLAQTYKDKMKSTEALADSLHDYLRKAQGYAEDVLADRDDLLNTIQDMENEERTRNDQDALMKVVMGLSLLNCMCGGSSAFLMCSVGLYLLSDVINSMV